MSAKDIVAHQFTSEKQPQNRGRKKGSLNRDTLLKKWLKFKTKFPNQNSKGEKIFEQLETDLQVTAEEKVVLTLIAKAWQGDVAAIKEILDTMYGKLKDKTEYTGKDGEDLFKNIKVVIVDGSSDKQSVPSAE